MIVKGFSAENLRQPTMEDLNRIESQFGSAGFPGYKRGVDFAVWILKHYPKGILGLMVGKYGVLTLRMEEIFDIGSLFWPFQFGFPDRNDDLNILDVSEYFCDMLSE